MTNNREKNEENEQKEKDMDWEKMLAYGCAISIGTLATLLVGASFGGLIGKAVKSIGKKKG